MPLGTEIKRKNRTVKVRWGEFHVAAMMIASVMETDNPIWDDLRKEIKEKMGDGPITIGGRDAYSLVAYHIIAQTPLNDGEYILKEDHEFLDPMDGEVFKLKAGDKLLCWRN